MYVTGILVLAVEKDAGDAGKDASRDGCPETRRWSTEWRQVT